MISLQVGQKFSLEHVTLESLFFWQFKAFAINLAVVVFPTPLIPVKSYALGVLPSLIELIIVCAITSWPIKSLNS